MNHVRVCWFFNFHLNRQNWCAPLKCIKQKLWSLHDSCNLLDKCGGCLFQDLLWAQDENLSHKTENWQLWHMHRFTSEQTEPHRMHPHRHSRSFLNGICSQFSCLILCMAGRFICNVAKLQGGSHNTARPLGIKSSPKLWVPLQTFGAAIHEVRLLCCKRRSHAKVCLWLDGGMGGINLLWRGFQEESEPEKKAPLNLSLWPGGSRLHLIYFST